MLSIKKRGNPTQRTGYINGRTDKPNRGWSRTTELSNNRKALPCLGWTNKRRRWWYWSTGFKVTAGSWDCDRHVRWELGHRGGKATAEDAAHGREGKKSLGMSFPAALQSPGRALPAQPLVAQLTEEPEKGACGVSPTVTQSRAEEGPGKTESK